MKSTLILISAVTLISLLFFACTPKPSQGTPQPTAPANAFGEVLTLKYGESMKVGTDNIKIYFAGLEDSRCPKEVNCMMAGKAKVKFQLVGANLNDKFELTCKGLCYKTDGSCGSEVTSNGYTVKLINVDPYPLKKAAAKEDCVVKFTVNK